MRVLITLILLLDLCLLHAQPDPRLFGNTITADDSRALMQILASEALEGRETGTRGQKMAAALIAHSFGVWDLEGPAGPETPYFQEIEFERVVPGDIYVETTDKRHHNFEKIVFWGQGDNESLHNVPLVFVGDGSKEALDLFEVKEHGVLAFVEGGYRSWRQFATAVYDQGATQAFIVPTQKPEEFDRIAAQFKSWLNAGSLRLPADKPGNSDPGIFLISPDLVAQFFQVSEKKIMGALASSGKGDQSRLKNIGTGEVSYKKEIIKETVISENVAGLIRGAQKPEEVVVITAHYDHLGIRNGVLYPGADDNGSGTCALMEIAEAFSIAERDGFRPARSILFLALTGEEEGLLGSEYYTQHPFFSLDNTVVNLNMDMVGHLDDAHPEDPNFVSVVGSDWLSSELHEIHETANEQYVGLKLDYTYNAKDHPERFYYRSDQYNFAQHGIPVIFYTSGDHEDYHQPSDTPNNIKYDRIQNVARLIFYTAWEIANRQERIRVDNISNN